jgi:50S ribosomal subunit-associated GTPase HflX
MAPAACQQSSFLSNGKNDDNFNKCENITDFSLYPNDGVFISAKYGQGLDTLKEKIAQKFNDKFLNCELKLDFSQLNKFYQIKDFLENYTMEYFDEYVKINLCVKKIFFSKVSTLIKNNNKD